MNKFTIASAIAAVTLAVSPASAAVFSYDLSDNTDAHFTKHGNYSYGLRLDGYKNEPNGEMDDQFILSFNAGSSTLQYDDQAGIAILSGTMKRSLSDGSFGQTWDVMYQMSGVTDLTGGLFIDYSGNGSGTVSSGGLSFGLGAGARAPDNEYFLLTDDSGRADGSGLPVGEGWVNTAFTGKTTNDFLFNATLNNVDDNGSLAPVPLPAAGWLLLAAFGGLGAMKRKRG